MAKKLKIAIAQLNPMVGDIQGNLDKMITSAIKARDEYSADIIVFPELCLTGYPPEDLLFRKAFLDTANHALNTYKSTVKNIYSVVGHPYQTSQGLLNSCSLIYNDTIVSRYAKQHLPNYGVFDEYRYFTPGNAPCVIEIKGIPVGIIICEDLWHTGPAQQAANMGARMILATNASPFEVDKHEQRHLTLAKRAKEISLPIVYVNCVGGQDELVFDGGSMVIDQHGKICQHAGFCKENLFPVDIEVTSTEAIISADTFTLPTMEERIYNCLKLGVQDYLHKNKFSGALIGVSGGIDSALSLAVAVDALGKENVRAMIMPSRYTSDLSMKEALKVVHNFGVAHDIISIEPTYSQFLDSLKPCFEGKATDKTEENLQARCRGNILMALSNKTGYIVLTTGNRSEMAVGYATLYGDMAGGFGVLKDIPKTLVYQLAHYRNTLSKVIPQDTLDRVPTAELAPNQTDQDTLPPYDILDKIIELYINQEQGVEEITAQGYDRNIVEKIVRLIYLNEYKRRQAPIGVRIHHKAFSRDRRYPITCGFNL